jgi:hypothetical protein
MLLNVTSADQTIDIFISDGGSFCNRRGQGRMLPSKVGAGGELIGLPEEY